MRINPLWLRHTKPKSGKGNNLNLITEAIRIASWVFEIEKRADQNSRAEVYRARKKNQEILFDAEYDQQYHKISQKQDPKRWFPDYWLTFLLLGLAAGDNGRTVLGAGNKFSIIISLLHIKCY